LQNVLAIKYFFRSKSWYSSAAPGNPKKNAPANSYKTLQKSIGQLQKTNPFQTEVYKNQTLCCWITSLAGWVFQCNGKAEADRIE
jgi:hypothetical protein